MHGNIWGWVIGLRNGHTSVVIDWGFAGSFPLRDMIDRPRVDRYIGVGRRKPFGIWTWEQQNQRRTSGEGE